LNTPFHLMILKAFSAQRNTIRPRMADLGLSPGQPKILNILTMRGECLQKDLAEACDIEPATVSKLLNNMEENHLITRGTVPGNKRAVEISITPKGSRLQKEISLACSQVERKALENFSEEERRSFESYLCRMYHNLTGKEMK